MESAAKLGWLGAFLLLTGCADEPAPDPPPAVDAGFIRGTRVYFGHQSVGRNVLAGIAEIAPGLRVVPLDQSPPDESGVLLESTIGTNGDPASKDREFLRAVERLRPGDVALYKYCYVDMTAETDPDSLFAAYASTIDSARQRGIRAIAVTMPVTTVEPAWKRLAKRALGRTTALELNARRATFNALIRERFAEGRLVDLARIESTLPDGRRCIREFAGSPVEVLPDSYTSDGAHLDARGRAQVASGFLRELASILRAMAP